MTYAIPIWLLLALGDPSGAPPEMAAASSDQERIDRNAYQAPAFLDARNATAASLRALDQISSDSSQVIPVDDAGRPSATYTTLTFAGGLEIRYRTFGQPEQVQILSIHIRSSRWKLRDGLKVGVPAEAVILSLGLPTDRSPRLLAYAGETEHVSFVLSSNRVAEIDFDYYAD